MEQTRWGTYNYYINSFLTDCKKQASIPSLFLLLQESAWRHAENHNFGYESLSENNSFWALSRIRACIHKPTFWKDSVVVKTWSKEPDAIMAYRDFEMFAENRSKLLSATSSWLILNTETRRPQRMSLMKDNFPIINKHAIAEPLTKLPVLNITESPDTVHTIPYSAIDVNGHVNNTLYIQWVLDNFPLNYINNYEVYDIEVNFLHESIAGQQYYIVTNDIAENEFLSGVVRYPDNKELAKIKLKFRKRNFTEPT